MSRLSTSLRNSVAALLDVMIVATTMLCMCDDYSAIGPRVCIIEWCECGVSVILLLCGVYFISYVIAYTVQCYIALLFCYAEQCVVVWVLSIVSLL